MPILLLGVFLTFFLLFPGMMVMDSDAITGKQMEIQRLLDNANHHATFAILEDENAQGFVELDEPQALARFQDRLSKNGHYSWNGVAFLPAKESITKSPVYPYWKYISFDEWEGSYQLNLQYTGTQLVESAFVQKSATGSLLQVEITDSKGQKYTLPPETLTGPSLITVAMIDDEGLAQTQKQMFPVVSVQEIQR